MKIDIIAGARPNFMKVVPIIAAIESSNNNDSQLSYRLVHIGQHYDKVMSESFFRQSGIPEPDVELECGVDNQIYDGVKCTMYHPFEKYTKTEKVRNGQ